MVNNNRDFIMSPKIDFAFKLIFGDEKNKNILLDFLCATLNLSDEDLMDIEFINCKFLPINRIHTKFHLLEDDSNYKLTDAIEIHFLELPKLNDKINAKDVNDEKLIEWLEFLNAESKGVMEVLAKKNKNIGLAYEILESASRDEKKRLAYESRQIAIMDEETRLEEAIEKGIGKGELIERYKNANCVISNTLYGIN